LLEQAKQTDASPILPFSTGLYGSLESKGDRCLALELFKQLQCCCVMVDFSVWFR
jgi:hypothetical protein